MAPALTPFGLGQRPLEVAGWSIGLINQVAAWAAAAAPLSQVVVPSAPDWVLPVSFVGLLFVCTCGAGRLRWGEACRWRWRSSGRRGLPPPEVWVSADGAAVAMREGKAAVLVRPDVKPVRGRTVGRGGVV